MAGKPKKAGRPNTKLLALRIDDLLYDVLEAEAKEYKISLQEMVRMTLETRFFTYILENFTSDPILMDAVKDKPQNIDATIRFYDSQFKRVNQYFDHVAEWKKYEDKRQANYEAAKRQYFHYLKIKEENDKSFQEWKKKEEKSG